MRRYRVISLGIVCIAMLFLATWQTIAEPSEPPLSAYTELSGKKENLAQILSQGLSYYYQKKDDKAVLSFQKYLSLHGKSAIAFRYLGIIYFRMGDLTQAMSHLEKAIESDPHDLESLQILGQTNLNLGKLEEAKKSYEQILKVDPLEIGALQILAQVYEKQQNRYKSISYYKRLLMASKKRIRSEGIYYALQKIGEYYYNKKNYAKATTYYKQLSKFDNGNLNSVYALAHLYKVQADLRRSTEQYLNVLKIKPNHKISRYELIDNYYLTDNPKVRAETKRFIDDFPKAPKLLKGFYAELMNQTEEAEYQFRLVLKKQPNTLSARIGMAKIYTKLKDYKNLKRESFFIVYLANSQGAFSISKKYALLSLRLLDQDAKEVGFDRVFLKKDGRSKITLLDDEVKELIRNYIDVYSAHAFTMDQLNNVQSATVYYRKSLFFLRFLKKIESKNKSFLKELKQKEYELLTNLGWLLHLKPLDKYSQSIKILAEAINLFPEESKANFFLGIVHYDHAINKNKKDYNLAVKYLKRAIEILPEKEIPSNYFFYLGASMEKIGQFKESEQLLQKAIKRDAENSSYKNYLGYIYSLKGIKYPEASELLLSALEDDPENEAYLDSLGWLLYKKGQYSEALEQLLLAVQQAEEKKNIDPIMYFHLAETYHKLKKFSLASNYFIKTLKNKEMASEEIDEVYIKQKLDRLKKKK